MTTDRRRLVPGEAEAGGYRPLLAADGEQHLVREDLTGASLPAGWRRSARPLLVIAQLSDTHVMDHQSPGRAELLDRYSDFDSPIRAAVGIVGSYRAQELFTYQVTEATSAEAARRPARNLVGRMIDAREVAYVVTFLASPKSVAIDGDTIAAGGGVPGVIYY